MPHHDAAMIVCKCPPMKCSASLPVVSHYGNVCSKIGHDNVSVSSFCDPVTRIVDDRENLIAGHQGTIRRDIDIIGAHHALDRHAVFGSPTVKPRGSPLRHVGSHGGLQKVCVDPA